VFGWDPRDQDVGEATYTVFYLGEAPVGGMMAMSEGVPEEMPAYWLTYFTVEDCDAAVEKAKELGGSITMDAMQMEGVGRFAVVADPQGASFGVISDIPS
jgi:predicted enzyme related to lactoylglutathione lyase